MHFAACAVFVSPPTGKSGYVVQKKIDPKSDTVVIVKKALALRAAVCFDKKRCEVGYDDPPHGDARLRAWPWYQRHNKRELGLDAGLGAGTKVNPMRSGRGMSSCDESSAKHVSPRDV